MIIENQNSSLLKEAKDICNKYEGFCYSTKCPNENESI